MFLQWLFKLAQLGGLVLLFGWSAFQFALLPVEPGARPAQGVLAWLLRRWRWAAAGGAVLLALGVTGQAVRIFGPLVSGLPWDLQLQYGWMALAGSRVGRLQLLQLGLTLIYAAVLILGRRRAAGGSPLVLGAWRGTLLLLTGAMAAAVVWGGHAASSLARWVSLAAQWSHLVVVCLWAGGLLLCACLPWRALYSGAVPNDPLLREGLRKLSGLGLVAVLTVVASGLVLAGLYIFNLTAAASSWYGRGIGLKIGLLGAVVAVAGVNRLLVLPRLDGAGDGPPPRWLGRLLGLEAVLVSVILAVSAAVTQLSPPSSPGVMAPQTWTLAAGPFRLEVFAFSPGASGVQFEIEVRDARTGRAAAVDALHFQVDMPGHFMGISPMVVPPVSPGRFVVQPPVSMAGPWRAAIAVEQDGVTYTAAVDFQVERAGWSHHSRLQRLLAGHPAGAASLVAAVAAIAAGLGLWLSWTGPAAERPGWGALPLGALLVAVGGMWAAQLVGLVPWGGESSAEVGSAGTSGALVSPGAGTSKLELAADAGQYLFWVTVEPASPGPNRLSVRLQDYVGDPVPGVSVRAQLLHPFEPEGWDPARQEVPDWSDMRAREVPLTAARDGMTYAGSLELEGEGGFALRFAAVADDSGAPVAEAFLPVRIPLDGARDLLRMADESMNRLQSVRLREELRGRPGGDAVTDMEFVSPNRVRMRFNNGRERIVIGQTRYERSGAGEPWTVAPWPQVGGFRWPNFNYGATAVRQVLVGRDEIDGRPVWVVNFVEEPPEIRYVVWIDAETYLIRRLTMHTTGHYMYWTFYDFNAPIAIEPPVNGAP